MAERTLNKVQILGRLGQDVDLRYTASGTAVATLSIATNEWQGKEKDDKTEWHRVVLWNKIAEAAGEYLKKGSQVYIEGRLETQQWEKDGQKRYTTQIVGREMIMLGGKGESSGNRPPHPAADNDGPTMTGPPPKPKTGEEYEKEHPPGEDIPF